MSEGDGRNMQSRGFMEEDIEAVAGAIFDEMDSAADLFSHSAAKKYAHAAIATLRWRLGRHAA